MDTFRPGLLYSADSCSCSDLKLMWQLKRHLCCTLKQNKTKLKKGTVIFALFILISFSCHKENEPQKCGCNGTKTESIVSDEKGLLIPCSQLTGSFRAGSQPVIVSGTLKIPCKKIPYEFKVTPIEISEIKLRDSTYNKTDITFTIIRSEDYGYDRGIGYFIEDHRSAGGIRVLQPHIPAIPGLIPFSTPDEATKTGVLVIYLIRNFQGLPSLSTEILQYINVIN